ncbi:MAG: aminoacyl-tRNA hydrolase [Actinomycetia bacterium]|nr:aminoacyl-tRNA hydrolase [Actinomycetes bacterium]
MILIIGLGNPGVQYNRTRHNIGFMAVARFAEGRKVSSYSKFNADMLKLNCCQQEILLAKPLTYMNRSGSSVSAILNHYGPEISQMLVIQDDLDIEFGKIRFKSGGSTAGHKGLESIVASTGSKEFHRLRIGIGRPPGTRDPADYVLQPFGKKEARELVFVLQDTVEAIEAYIEHGLNYVMNKYN